MGFGLAGVLFILVGVVYGYVVSRRIRAVVDIFIGD
jgi:uncharacterized protein YneF (UPF0154 family)